MSNSELTRRAITSGLASSALAGGATRANGKAVVGFSLCRGIGVYHMMQAPVRAGADGAPVWPAFEGACYDMPDVQIEALKAAGFDFVRLALAPDVFLRAAGTDAKALYATLQAKVRRFTDHGLSVIVTFMPGSAVPWFANADFANNTAGVFEALCTVVSQCASTLADAAPGRVAIEPLNEPALYGLAELRWAGMQQSLHQAVRTVSPHMPVVLTGAEGGGRDGLLKLDPASYRGSNVVYSFHYYEPHLFTHQHVGESFRYLSGVGWPPRLQDLPAVMSRAQVAIAADAALSIAARAQTLARVRSLLTNYYASGVGPSSVAADFARVAAWADAHGIDRRRVLLGEFGVTRSVGGYAGAPDTGAAVWLDAVRTSAERNGFPWALWAFSGPTTMTLANEYPACTFAPWMLRALGLRAVQPKNATGQAP